MTSMAGLLIEIPEQTLEDIRSKYLGKYLVLEVTRRDSCSQPTHARVLICAETEEEAFERAKANHLKGVAFLHNVPREEMDTYALIL